MEMACQPGRWREALLAAAHIRERDAGTAWLVRDPPTHAAPQERSCSLQGVSMWLGSCHVSWGMVCAWTSGASNRCSLMTSA